MTTKNAQMVTANLGGPGAEARWYCLSREGIATLCVDEQDAVAVAAQSNFAWPNSGPHRAVRLVDAAEIERLRAALIIGHTYAEFCPTPASQDDRDPDCPACAALGTNVAANRPAGSWLSGLVRPGE